MAIVLVEQYYDFAEELADDYIVIERGDWGRTCKLMACGSWLLF